MPDRLTHDRITALRRTPGASVLLYVTDRCPVGCRHCSVSALPRGVGVADRAGFASLVAELGARPGLRVVAVSGGEPFVERRGLTVAVDTLAEAGKALVVFTSGHWAGPGPAPVWIREVLGRVSTVVLGVDAFHAERLGPERLPRAVDAVVEAGGHVVLQVIDRPGEVDAARRLLRDRLGAEWPDRAEIHPTPLLPWGRAAGLLPEPAGRPASEFGPCLPASAPTVRHDGTVTGCCNEQVITGAGPAALRRRCGGGGEAERSGGRVTAGHVTAGHVTAALDAFARDPLLRIMARTGPGALSGLPGFEELSVGRYPDVCAACWAAHDAVAGDPRAAAVAGVLASVPAGVPVGAPVRPDRRES